METTTVTLSTPIKRGETEIAEITLYEPTAGSLRGLSVSDVMQMKTDAVVTLAPRISDPKLTESEMSRLRMRDLAIIGAGIAGFFLTGEEREALQNTPSQSA